MDMSEEIVLRSETVNFNVAPEILEKGVSVVVFTIGGLTNRESDPEFVVQLNQSVQRILAGLAEILVAEDKILQFKYLII